MHQSHDALPLPPRYDYSLAIGAAVGYGGLAAFFLTQLDPSLRIHGDTRFAIVQWCATIAAVASMSWLLRPHSAHMAYAMRLGRRLAVLPGAPDVQPRRTLAARRWLWGACGTLGACSWTIVAGLDIGAATGKLALHQGGLDLTSMILCQLGAVCEVVRIVGPSLAAVDDIYRLAHTVGRPRDADADILALHRSVG